MSSFNVKIVGLAKYFLTCLLTLLLSLSITGLAQDITERKIDSLRNKISKIPEDSSKVYRLILLSDYLLQSGKKEEAMETVGQAHKMATTISFNEGVAISLLQRSEIHLAAFNHNSALSTANQAYQIYESENNDIGKAKALVVLGRIQAGKSAHDEAIRYFNQALAITKENSDIEMKADILLRLSTQYNYKGLSDKGREFGEYARDAYLSSNNYKGLSMAYNSVGEAYRRQSRYTEAMENYHLGLKITEDYQLENNKSSLLNNMGLIFIEQKKFKEAIDTYLKLVQINKKLKNPRGIALNCNNIGLSYVGLGQNNKAIEFYQEGLEINKSVKSKRIELILLSNMGEAHLNTGQYNRALRYYSESYKISEETANEESMTYGLNGLALTQIYLHQFESAANYLERARTLALQKGFHEPLMENYQSMVKLDSMQHNFLGAFEWYKKYNSLKNSLDNELKSKQITEIHAQYESEKKDKEILQLNQTKELDAMRHANERKLFGIVVVFLALLTAGLIYVVLKRRQVNRVLRSQKREIEEQNNELNHINEEIKITLETVEQQNRMLHDKNIKLQELHREKDGLIGVVAHDLRSPIAKAQGLAELMKNAGPLNEKQLEFINLIRSVCKNGMRLIEDLLMLNMAENTTTKANCTTIDLNKFLADQVRNYEAAAEKKNITLHYKSELPDKFQIISDRDYLIRIIDNLLSNAIKFTFPYHAVFFEVINKSDHVIFIIRDEGQGMNEEDKSNLFQKFKRLSARPTAGETSTGLGLSIVKTLVTKLNGNITVESEEGKGTTFTIELPFSNSQ